MINKKGFTLIELLVVVAIIGLLSTLSIVALNTARAKARDSRRVSDIKQIQTALELYYNDNAAYPSSTLNSLVPAYMGQVPTNPTPTNDGPCAASYSYTYTSQSSNRSYALAYCLGDPVSSLPEGYGTATPAGIK